MSRSFEARGKRARRLFVAVTHLSAKDPDKDPSLRRPYPPGQHGPTRRTKLSDYAVRLMEKQKLKLAYELLEKPFRAYVSRAKRSGSNAANVLIALLESRLDSMVYQAGFATSMRQARQFVRHGYFTVNGRRADFPRMELTPGMEVKLIERMAQHPLIVSVRARTANRGTPAYLAVPKNDSGFTVVGAPDDPSPRLAVDLSKVIEFYA